MTTYQITAPEPQFSGEVAGVNFSRGKATVDGDHPEAAAALAYFRRRGYGVDGSEPTAGPAEPFEPVDPRGIATVESGTLRDGAVEPRATDAGLPTNAGVANPHGRQVVSPEAPTPPGQELSTEASLEEGKAAGRPTRGASKAEWQAYARSQAKDSNEEATIDGMTKDELVARYGGGS
ncbi:MULTISPECIES: hypothetical protein [Streptomyces]|uniref:hypothetical protein n=1 Tax=Streptomyces TaxID=1883 RepID=UPI001678990F|nr:MULTISPECIES: hypothetical protein [Streptomyces]MBK3524821.1 hypothetical protein [Streptomyces sp. MBT70]GGR71132.1 hypothetical protein GCM10010236_26780 [Streptomyces eurythermus]